MNVVLWIIGLMIISTILYKNFQLCRRLNYHVQEHRCMSRSILIQRQIIEEQKEIIEQLKIKKELIEKLKERD